MSQTKCRLKRMFECKQPGCSYVFPTFDMLQDYVDFGEHGLNVQPQEGIYDRLHHEWAYKFSTLSLTQVSRKEKKQPAGQERVSPKEAWKSEGEGWALQKPRGGNTRFLEKVKSFLKDKFYAGNQTGRKADSAQVAADIRKVRNADGTRKFSGNEWLTKAQVQSVFSRLLSLNRKASRALQRKRVMMKMIFSWRKSSNIWTRNSETRKLIFVIKLVDPPIMYDGYDLCEQVTLDKLSAFTVSTLRTMCKHFKISFRSKDNKPCLMDKIKEMVRECRCSHHGPTD